MRLKFLLLYLIVPYCLANSPIQTESDVLIHNITHKVNVQNIALLLFDELIKQPKKYSYLIEKYDLKRTKKLKIKKLREKIEEIISLHDIEKVHRDNVAGIFEHWGNEASDKFKAKLNDHGKSIIQERLKDIAPTKQELELSSMLELFADQIDRYKNPISPFEFGRAMTHPAEYSELVKATDEVSLLFRHDQGRALVDFGIKKYPKVAKDFKTQKNLMIKKLNHLNYIGIDHRKLDSIEAIKFTYAIADFNKNILIQIFTHAHKEFFEAAKHSTEGRMVFYHNLYKFKLYLAKQEDDSLKGKIIRYLDETAMRYFKLFREIEAMEISCI